MTLRTSKGFKPFQRPAGPSSDELKNYIIELLERDDAQHCNQNIRLSMTIMHALSIVEKEIGRKRTLSTWITDEFDYAMIPLTKPLQIPDG